MFGVAIVIESAVAYKFRNWNDLMVYFTTYYVFCNEKMRFKKILYKIVISTY